MNFAINKIKLQNLLKKSINIVNKKSTIQSITNFYMKVFNGVLTVYATNLEMYVLCQESVSVKEEGEFLIKAHLLFDISKKLTSSEIIFKTEKNKIIIIDDTTHISLCLSTESFPEKNIDHFKKYCTIDGKVFINLLNSILLEINDGVVQVLIKQNSFTITLFNNRRMSFTNYLMQNEIENDFSFICTIHSIEQIIKFLDTNIIEILLDANKELAIKSNNLFLVTKLINIKNIPDHNNIININKCLNANCDSRKLSNALDTALTTSSALSRDVQLIFEPNQIEIKSCDLILGGATRSIIEGDLNFTGSIRINCKHLLDILKKSEKNVYFFYQSNKLPFMVKTEMNNVYKTSHILMPLVGI